jgi:hypothetical protein
MAKKNPSSFAEEGLAFTGIAAIPPPALSGSGSRVEGFGPPLSLATPRLPVH